MKHYINPSWSSVYLIVGLGVNGSSPLCALQGLLHLLHLDGQMGLEVPAQRHAGVLGCLPAGEYLIITQQGSLVLWVQDLQCADLTTVSINHTLVHNQQLLGYTLYHLLGINGYVCVLNGEN